MSLWGKQEVPWNGPDEWVVWLILLIVATLIIHNGMRTYKKASS